MSEPPSFTVEQWPVDDLKPILELAQMVSAEGKRRSLAHPNLTPITNLTNHLFSESDLLVNRVAVESYSHFRMMRTADEFHRYSDFFGQIALLSLNNLAVTTVYSAEDEQEGSIPVICAPGSLIRASSDLLFKVSKPLKAGPRLVLVCGYDHTKTGAYLI